MNWKNKERLEYVVNMSLGLGCWLLAMVTLALLTLTASYAVINMVDIGPSILMAKP